MLNSKAQIIATIGPASIKPAILEMMIEHQLDVVRLNFSWSNLKTRRVEIDLIRQLAKKHNHSLPIIIDLPGPRVQEGKEHTYDRASLSAITLHDKEFIKFAVEEKVEYVAVSFVGSAEDIKECRKIINDLKGRQKIIAKIERAQALEKLEEIILVSDAVMIARGDLGEEMPIEQIPFIQDRIIKMCKKLGKPVIVATQMLLSMVEHPLPTRAEVTDVANAILEGADAVMLSEETAQGKYPVEAITIMEKILVEAEKHLQGNIKINPL